MTNLNVREISARYGEQALVELPAIDRFVALGWETANLYQETFGSDGTEGRVSASEVILVCRLRKALERINPRFPASAYEQAIAQLTEDRSKALPVNANYTFYKLLRDRLKVEVTDDEGNPQTVELLVIDWSHPENNDFFLARQMWVSGEMYKRRCDLLGFVNGIPLVFIELKGPHVPLKSAYDENLKDYKGQSIPQLFHSNAFIMLSNGMQTRVGTITSVWEHFFEWKRIDDEEEAGSTTLDTAIRGLCDKARLLDIVENFTLFEEARGGLIKKVAKNHQYLGVNKAIAQMLKLREAGDIEAAKRLGVFWHTQGSGKSLSMVFFTQKILRKLPGKWTFVIVTDRAELDDQIYKTFSATGAITGAEVQANSGGHLRMLLGEDHRYVFSLIQKFHTDKGGIYPKLSDRSDIIVITDEAHRSQYDIFALNMRNALPHAAFLGFTGTPLIAGEEERTREVFGEYVSVYDFARSIEDGATVPLYYENRTPELQITNENLNEDIEKLLEDAELDETQESRLERVFAREYHLITRDDRLETIAADLVKHFLGRGYRGKAMMVCIDKATAVRMYDKVQVQWKKQLARLRKQMKTATRDELVGANSFATEQSGRINSSLQEKIMLMETIDMADVDALLDDSIATEGYRIGDKPQAEALIDLSQIDFAELQRKFEQGKKATETEKLKGQIEKKLAVMVRENKGRLDFLEKFQKLIEAYNASSHNLEVFFKELLAFARNLTVEEQRATREDLTEEELAIFDLLTQPDPKLSDKEKDEVKKVARELLAKLKAEKLVLDWKLKTQTKADVEKTIRDFYIKLPSAYTAELKKDKRVKTYAHVYENYFGAGKSVYHGSVA